MKYTDPHDVEYIASVLCAAHLGSDSYNDMTAYNQIKYKRMADAVLRAIEIREVME